MSGPNPAPLSVGQLTTLGASAARELGWGLRAVRSELAAWRRRALAIPDPSLRRDALAAQADKRLLVDGAALFWILPARRRPELLRLLVAFQTLANLVDRASEHAARGEAAGSCSSTLVLLDAIDLDRPTTGYDAGWRAIDDGGYVLALVEASRAGCATLPRYREGSELLRREAARARSFDIEHDLDRGRRTERMRQFADREFGGATGARWWELVAGASSLLTVIVLLALVADEQTTPDDLERAAVAYGWAARASALLDNYVDQLDDARTGAHNYLNYYPAAPVERIASVIDRSLREAAGLRHGDRHLVIISSMTAMFLSSDGARSGPLRQSTGVLAARGGSLTRLLIPILRLWRVAYRERAG